MSASFDALLAPQSVAVIGASTREGSVGRDVLANLVASYRGTLVAVNPKATEILGVACYPSVAEIPHPIDLAVIIVPAAGVPAVLTAAADRGARAAIVISAGFKEAGHPELEADVAAIAHTRRITLIGPNCLGVIAPASGLNASFAAAMPAAGGVAFLSQSGALCTAVLDHALAHGIGFSTFLSMGNKAATDEAAVLDYLATDAATRVVAMYVESIADGAAFLAAARRLTRAAVPKPVIVLKSGRTAAGAGAAASHTGALAGDDAAYDALLSQAGVIRAATVAEFFDLIAVALHNPLPAGSRTAIITNAGGVGVLATDAAVESGLTMARLSDATTATLTAGLPPAASSHNPVDVLGDAHADRYALALDAVAADPGVDSLLVLLTPQSMTETDATAAAIIAAREKYHTPIVAAFMGEGAVATATARLEEAGVAVLAEPMHAARALGILTRFAQAARSAPADAAAAVSVDATAVAAAQETIAAARADGRTALMEPESLAVLAAFGFPVLPWRVARDAAAAAAAVAAIGRPCVFKVVSPQILHKSDVGGVRLRVTPENAAGEYDALMTAVATAAPDADIRGVLVVAMAEGEGTEMIVGATRDALGTLVMTGLGGIFVEVFRDVAFGLAPLERADVVRMLTSLKGYPLLAGARGQTPRDTDALTDAITHFAAMLGALPDVAECDLNPVRVMTAGHGLAVLDARIILTPPVAA